MLKIFTMKYSEKNESFPDSAMSDFLADKEVLRWESHFFERKGDFFWTVLAEYRASSVQGQVKQGEEKVEKKGEGYKEILTDADWPLFKMLKEWRGEESKNDGIPPYIICNNMQLARISVMKPNSLNELQNINGIGKAKIEKYGKDILRIVSSCGQLPTFENEEVEEGEMGNVSGTNGMSGISGENIAGEGVQHE